MRRRVGRFGSKVLTAAYQGAKSIPAVRARVNRDIEEVMAKMRGSMRPYAETSTTHATLPPQGVPRAEILDEMERMAQAETARW